MIVWLNGTFGAGKTTTPRELVTRLPDARIFDAEHVGSLSERYFPSRRAIQHLPPWRPLVVETATRILPYAGGTLIVPQTVLIEAYVRVIFDGLAENEDALAYGDRHPHQVQELRLDQVEVDDVAARLAEQGDDVDVLGLLGGR